MKVIISDSLLCTGCSACSQVCPRGAVAMKANDEGFLYPFIDEGKCNDCSLCTRTCPVNRALGSDTRVNCGVDYNVDRSADGGVDRGTDGAVAGADMGKCAGGIKQTVESYGKKAYACYTKNDEVRAKSSSGGIFSQLAAKTLEKKGVVFGAGFDSEFNVKHRFVDNIEDLDGLRRSKYVQSEIANTFSEVKRFLNEGRHVLFCGTPCQIAGLKAYLGRDHETLVTCDLACFGVPSPKVWSMYLDYLEMIHGNNIESVSFRDKSGGWKDYRMVIGFKNGGRYQVEAKKELYFIGFGKNILSRSSCFDCKFRLWNSSADITLADFWGIEKMGGIIDDDNRGVSLAITHNAAGEGALKEIGDEVCINPCDVSEAVKYNPRLVSSAAEPAGRRAFFADMAGGYDFDRLRKKYMDNVSLKYKIKCMLKRMLNRMPARVEGKNENKTFTV